MGFVTNATALSLLAACGQRGVKRESILAAARLSEESVWEDARLPQSDLHRLWRAALELSGDSDLSIHAAEAAPPGAYGVLDFMMAHAPTLGEGLERAARYFPLIHTGVHLKVLEESDECLLDVGRNSAYSLSWAAALTLGQACISLAFAPLAHRKFAAEGDRDGGNRSTANPGSVRTASPTPFFLVMPRSCRRRGAARLSRNQLCRAAESPLSSRSLCTGRGVDC